MKPLNTIFLMLALALTGCITYVPDIETLQQLKERHPMLGYEATDKITGLEGVITAKALFLYGPTRYELLPTKLQDKRPADSVWLDEGRIEQGKKRVIEVPPVPITVQLGDKAKDTLTGFEGIVSGVFVFANGCVRVEITPKALKDGKPIDPAVFDEQRLLPKASKAERGGDRPGPTPYRSPKSY